MLVFVFALHDDTGIKSVSYNTSSTFCFGQNLLINRTFNPFIGTLNIALLGKILPLVLTLVDHARSTYDLLVEKFPVHLSVATQVTLVGFIYIYFGSNSTYKWLNLYLRTY